jgi:ketosteroid isomerase-like protein
MKLVRTVSGTLFLLAAIGWSQPPPKSAVDEESAVRQADEAWMRAIVSKSVDQAVELYDPEVLTAGSAMPPARGLAEVRAMWTKLFAQPGFVLTWKTENVLIADSGSIASSTGTWRGDKPDATGPFLAVWRKQRDGKWKVLIDSAWYSRTPD